MACLKTLGVIGLVGSIVWVIAEPGYEPALTLVASLITLVSAFVVEKRRAHHQQQHQSVSKSSTGVQAGGDITIVTRGEDKDAA